MVKHMLMDAISNQVNSAYLQASPVGLSLYKKLGFKETCQIKTYTHQRRLKEGGLKMGKKDKSTHEKTSKNKYYLSDFFMKGLLSPTIAACVDRMVFHPVDNIITTQQSKNTRAMQAVNLLYEQQGLKGFYYGMRFTWVSSILSRLCFFGFYYNMRDYLSTHYRVPQYKSYLITSIAAAFLDAAVMCPSENYRTRATLNIKTHGRYSYRSFYQGFIPMLLKGVAGSTFILAGSDYLDSKIKENVIESCLSPFISGYMTGALVQPFVTPFDVLKTRMMATQKPGPILEAVKSIALEKVMFRGLFVRCNRVGASVAISIGVIKNVNKKYDDYSLGRCSL